MNQKKLRILIMEHFLIANITSVLIPTTVTSIGEVAFQNCGSLTSVIIPDSVTRIGIDAFRDCGSLTSITLPNSITCISTSAFFDCSSLTSITLPDCLKSIGDYVFIIATISLVKSFGVIKNKTIKRLRRCTI